jgi:hypothetical protein
MDIKGSPVEIHIPKEWNLIGSSVTAPPPVLSPSRILPEYSPHCAFISSRRNYGRFKKLLFQVFLLFLKFRKS